MAWLWRYWFSKDRFFVYFNEKTQFCLISVSLLLTKCSSKGSFHTISITSNTKQAFFLWLGCQYKWYKATIKRFFIKIHEKSIFWESISPLPGHDIQYYKHKLIPSCMMIVKQVYLDHLNRPVGSFEALKSGLINKSQTTHDRLEKIWKKNGENVEQKWRKCGAKMELIRKESGENPEKTKRDVGRTVFSCYCLFVRFPHSRNLRQNREQRYPQ